MLEPEIASVYLESWSSDSDWRSLSEVQQAEDEEQFGSVQLWEDVLDSDRMEERRKWLLMLSGFVILAFPAKLSSYCCSFEAGKIIAFKYKSDTDLWPVFFFTLFKI